MEVKHKPGLVRSFLSRLDKIRSLQREGDKSRSRSARWDEVRDEHLASYPFCLACGGRDLLQVHHIVPFSVAPDLELVGSNLVTLCMGAFDCHLYIGHGGSFRFYNPHVLEHAGAFQAAAVGGRLRLLKEAKDSRRR